MPVMYRFPLSSESGGRYKRIIGYGKDIIINTHNNLLHVSSRAQTTFRHRNDLI